MQKSLITSLLRIVVCTLCVLSTPLYASSQTIAPPVLSVANRLLDETDVSRATDLCSYYKIHNDSIVSGTAYFSSGNHHLQYTLSSDNVPLITITGYNSEKEVKPILAACGYTKAEDGKKNQKTYTNGRRECILMKQGKTITLFLTKIPFKRYD